MEGCTSRQRVIHQQPRSSGCSVSRVAHSGQRLVEQMALPRRNAFWASWVMASASSSITNLKPFLQDEKTAVWDFPLVVQATEFSLIGGWRVVNRFLVLLEDGSGAGKTQNGTSHNANASVIRCVKLQNTVGQISNRGESSTSPRISQDTKSMWGGFILYL